MKPETQRYLLSVYRPVGYDHIKNITPAVLTDIVRVNDEMESAGVRAFVCGLHPITAIQSVLRAEDGSLSVVSGPAENEERFLDGFWVLEVESESEATDWAKRAAQACRATIEVRPLYS